jgi:hypothetical protein
MNDKVTVCLHTGKYEYVYLLQNAIKSFILGNSYPNIELMIIETGKNSNVRKWIENLDLYNFLNFQGSYSNIKPRKNVNIEIKSIFPDFKDSNSLFSENSAPFIQSLEIALEKSTGKYFTYLAEDNQFIIDGNVIEDHIKVLKKENEEKSMIHFVTHQLYKYKKKNNKFLGPNRVEDFLYFSPLQVKWDQNIFCNKSLIYNQLGSIKDWQVSHGVNENYTKIANQKKLKRFYAGICPFVWFHNNEKINLINKIKNGTNKNPEFILLKMHEYKKIKNYYNKIVNDVRRPLSTEEFMIYNEVKK